MACSAAVLGACTTDPVDGTEAGFESHARTVELLRYAQLLVQLPPLHLARQRRELERVYQDGSDPEARLRLALLLREARSPDPVRARERVRLLLDEHLADPNAPGRDLAAFVRHLVTEQIREAREAEMEAAAERVRVADLRRELAEVSTRLERERRRRLELERQLEALKAIEREIKQRAAPAMPAQ